MRQLALRMGADVRDAPWLISEGSGATRKTAQSIGGLAIVPEWDIDETATRLQHHIRSQRWIMPCAKFAQNRAITAVIFHAAPVSSVSYELRLIDRVTSKTPEGIEGVAMAEPPNKSFCRPFTNHSFAQSYLRLREAPGANCVNFAANPVIRC